MQRARFPKLSLPFLALLLGAAPLLLAGCDDEGNTTTTDSGTKDGGEDGAVIGNDGGDGGAQAFTLGGTVTGLNGSLTLKTTDGAELTLTENGAFAFDGTLADGATYDAGIVAAPGVQTCTLANGAGTVDGADVTNLTVFCEDLVFFTAYDETHGAELWVTDGTTAGTRLVKDIVAGTGFSNPTGFKNVGGTVYFSANGGGADYELWKTDGTEAGTTLVADLRQDGPSFPFGFVELNGKILFRAIPGESGYRLFVYDGVNPPSLLKGGALTQGSEYSTVLNGRILFAGDDGLGAGVELWSTDGTDAGTSILKDLNDGEANGNPSSFANAGSYVLFSCDTGTGPELCVSDGTEAGTKQIKEIQSGPQGSIPNGFTVLNGGLTVFFAVVGVEVHMFASDGTEEGTVEIQDFAPTSNGGGTVAFGRGFFYIQDAAHGAEVWVSDGTMAGTFPLEVVAGSNGSAPDIFNSTGDLLCFRANDGTHGSELWCTDGTEGGTALVKDINPSGDGAFGFSFGARKGHTFFFADDGSHGVEPWVTDGTEAGTFMLKDVSPGEGWSLPLD